MKLAVLPFCVNRLERKTLGKLNIFGVAIHLDPIYARLKIDAGNQTEILPRTPRRTRKIIPLFPGAAGSWTTLNTMAVQASPSFRKPVTSVYNAVKFAGYAASPVILSPLYSLFQIRAVRWGCMAAILIAAMLAFMAGEPVEEGNDDVS